MRSSPGWWRLGSRRSADPRLPRWTGYLTLFVAWSFLPDVLVPFFKSGPASWAGLLPFYVPFASFLVWVPIITWHMARAIQRDRRSPVPT